MIPDWNSLESVQRAHSRLELLSIIFFGLLAFAEAVAHRLREGRAKHTLDTIGIVCFVVAVCCEAAAYPYGQRNDTLSGIVIGSLDAKARSASTTAQAAIDNAGKADAKADLANGKSLLAGRNAEKADHHASEAELSASRAYMNADQAKRSVADLEMDARGLQNKLATTSDELKAVDTKRAELEKSLINLAICNAPRIINFWISGGHTAVDPLIPVRGRVFFIEYVPEAEAKRAAVSLANALRAAGAQLQQFRSVEGLPDGVAVEPSLDYRPDNKGMRANDGNAYDVANLIVDFLHSYNWQARNEFLLNEKGRLMKDGSIVPFGVIRIQIGLYPAVEYVGSPGEKILEEGLRENNEMMRAAAKAADEAAQVRREKQLQSLPADIRRMVEERQKSWQEEHDKFTRRDEGPCRTLTPISTR